MSDTMVSKSVISRFLALTLFALLFVTTTPFAANAFCLSGDNSGPNIAGITLRDSRSLASFPDDVVSGRVRSDIIAGDPSGMHIVNWYIDNVFIKSYAYSLHQSSSYLIFNSARLQNGLHTISVEIIDGCGLSNRFDKPFATSN